MLILSAPVNCHIMLEEINDTWKISLPKLLDKINICTLHVSSNFKATDLKNICELINDGKVTFNIHLSHKITELDDILPSLQKCQHLNYFMVDILNIPEMIAELSACGFTILASLRVNGKVIEEDLIEQTLNDGAQSIVLERSPDDDPQVLRKAITQIQEYRDLGYNIKLSSCFPNCTSGMSEQNCFAGVVSCALNISGQLAPCRHSQEWSKLNLIDNSLEEVWQDPVFKPWRDYQNIGCDNCPKSGLCYGGCKLHPNDPLISQQNPRQDQSLQDVILEEGLYPLPLYRIRKETFGLLLMREDRVIPVSEKAAAVLELFDGKHSLRDIKNKLGFGVIPFIYSLQMRNFINLQEM